MAIPESIRIYCKELSLPDAERANQFYKTAQIEAKISYGMYMQQNILPRQVFLRGYDAMYASASLFISKKFRIKIDDHLGGTHNHMRKVLDFLTQEAEQHQKLISLYEIALEKFNSLSRQYHSEGYFAKRVVRDLADEGYHQGKKANYYNEDLGDRKDPLSLSMEDAKQFISDIVEPFLFIMEELTA